MTTSVKAAVRGDVHAAFTANPFGILAVVTAILLLARPAWRRIQLPAGVLVGGALVSWFFQLHRFHFV
jgi:hypothetical protein